MSFHTENYINYYYISNIPKLKNNIYTIRFSKLLRKNNKKDK